MGGKSNANRVFIGNPERNNPLARPEHRCADNIKVGHKETG
jgi:hypothetical protein